MMDSETIGLPQNRDMLISHFLSPYNPLGELFDFDSHLILHSLITHNQAVGSWNRQLAFSWPTVWPTAIKHFP